jgi:hypothetical protein
MLLASFEGIVKTFVVISNIATVGIFVTLPVKAVGIALPTNIMATKPSPTHFT